jgi:hypothetical protein
MDEILRSNVVLDNGVFADNRSFCLQSIFALYQREALLQDSRPLREDSRSLCGPGRSYPNPAPSHAESAALSPRPPELRTAYFFRREYFVKSGRGSHPSRPRRRSHRVRVLKPKKLKSVQAPTTPAGDPHDRRSEVRNPVCCDVAVCVEAAQPGLSI